MEINKKLIKNAIEIIENNLRDWESQDYETIKHLNELINKPVETTNEQPTSEQIDNALDCLHGDNSYNHSKVISYLIDRLT